MIIQDSCSCQFLIETFHVPQWAIPGSLSRNWLHQLSGSLKAVVKTTCINLVSWLASICSKKHGKRNMRTVFSKSKILPISDELSFHQVQPSHYKWSCLRGRSKKEVQRSKECLQRGTTIFVCILQYLLTGFEKQGRLFSPCECQFQNIR